MNNIRKTIQEINNKPTTKNATNNLHTTQKRSKNSKKSMVVEQNVFTINTTTNHEFSKSENKETTSVTCDENTLFLMLDQL